MNAIATQYKIGIIGAGTSGLFLAILLMQRGYQVDIFEKSPHPRTDGCGILLVSDGMEVLRQGNRQIWSKIIDGGVRASNFEFRNLKGNVVSSNTPEYDEKRSPGILIHRKRILETLLEFLPQNCLHLDAEFHSIAQTEEKVTVKFNNDTEWSGDLLIGADGLYSQVRELIVPGVKPFYLGDLVWRGVVADDSFCTDGNFIVYVRGRGIYANFFDLGNGLTHWGFFIEQEKTSSKTGYIPIPPTELAKLPPEPRRVIESTPPSQIVTRYSHDIDTLPTFHNGRILLIGDAAHAKSPTRARGMTSGLEDGLALARILNTESDIIKAIDLYEAERKPIVHEYQQTSRHQSLTIGRRHKRKVATVSQ